MNVNQSDTSDALVAQKPVVDYDAIDLEKTHQVSEFKHKFPLTSCRVDPTGKYVVAGAQDLDIQVWDLQTKSNRTLKGHTSWVRSFDFSKDGSRLYSAC